MTGWAQPQQCDAIDPSGRRCVLPLGHVGDHAATPSPVPPVEATNGQRSPTVKLLGRLAVVVVVLLVIGYFIERGSGGRVGVAGGNAAPRAVEQATGSGIMNSAPLHLAGTYEVAWSAKSEPGRQCYHGTNLRTTADERSAELVSKTVSGDEAGVVYVYDLQSGDYFVNANSGCAWSFTFTPR